ncbi:unnamed protein product [Aphis gossypii]|uniref:Uncharacterized protein n=1 Tax=Aphis gossypii TaxID=80765 RepID=A0A9P0NIV0_APHGO|nr:unnamed protein product [Aphis gossypii]
MASVVDCLCVAVGWTAMGTPGRRRTVDLPEEPVEATVTRHQLREVKGHLSVRPGHPAAEQARRNQRTCSLTSAVRGWIRLVDAVSFLSHKDDGDGARDDRRGVERHGTVRAHAAYGRQALHRSHSLGTGPVEREIGTPGRSAVQHN